MKSVIEGRFASLKGVFASLLDASSAPLVREALAGGDRRKTGFALDLLRQAPSADVRLFAPELHRLLDHDSAELRLGPILLL